MSIVSSEAQVIDPLKSIERLKNQNNFSISDSIDQNDERQSLWAAQREYRGFDDTELWNLDVTLARFLLPRLKAFIENNDPYQNDPEYKEILDKIIYTMEQLNAGEILYDDKMFEGAHMLGEYLYALWS